MGASPRGIVEDAIEIESVLRAYLYRFTRNVADVEELLQETYARILSRAEVSAQIQSSRAFTLTIARNVALDFIRRRQIVSIELVADMEDLAEMGETAQIEELIATHQELTILAEFIETLPARCRQAFTLRKVYGFSQKEIAERMNISVHTVEQHLTKAAHLCASAFAEIERTAPSRALALAHPKRKVG